MSQEVIDKIFAVINEGRDCRRNGTSNQYAGGTLEHCLSAHGWVTEDLRIALMKANPVYESGQATFGQGLKHLPRAVS